MNPFTIPTAFTAYDGYSAKVGRMEAATGSFGSSLGVLNAKMDRTFNRFIPASLTKATKTLLNYGEAAIFIEGAMKTGKGIMDYETEIANLSAVTGATGDKLDQFKEKIAEVSYEQKKGAAMVAQAFTNVDNNMPQYHTNIEALKEVTRQSVILAKASRTDLGPSAEYLTLSMNQFSLGADKAGMAVDALAAGAVSGSSKIQETSEAMQVFGSVAANVAKVSYAESVAIVEMASKFEKGAEAGTRIRNILLDMTNVKYGPARKEVRALGVDLNKVADTSLPFIDRFRELSKIKDNPQAMEKLFDKRNVALASGLFSVIDKYDKIYAATSKVGVAEQMAETNTDTLAETVNQLAAAWETEIATSGKVGVGLKVLKGVMRFTTDHMDGLVTTTTLLIGGIYGLKAAEWSLVTTTKALNYVQGLSYALTKNYTSALLINTNASREAGIASAMYLRSLGPLGLLGITGAVAAGITAIAIAVGDDYKETYKLINIQDKLKRGFVQEEKAITASHLAMEDYNNAMRDYNDLIQFRAVQKYEHDKGAMSGFWFDIKNAFKHPILSSQSNTAVPVDIYKPDMSKYPHLDTTLLQQQIRDTTDSQVPLHAQTDPKLDNEQTMVKQEKPTINLYVNVDKDGNVTADSGRMGIPVNVGSTSKKYSV